MSVSKIYFQAYLEEQLIIPFWNNSLIETPHRPISPGTGGKESERWPSPLRQDSTSKLQQTRPDPHFRPSSIPPSPEPGNKSKEPKDSRPGRGGVWKSRPRLEVQKERKEKKRERRRRERPWTHPRASLVIPPPPEWRRDRFRWRRRRWRRHSPSLSPQRVYQPPPSTAHHPSEEVYIFAGTLLLAASLSHTPPPPLPPSPEYALRILVRCFACFVSGVRQFRQFRRGLVLVRDAHPGYCADLWPSPPQPSGFPPGRNHGPPPGHVSPSLFLPRAGEGGERWHRAWGRRVKSVHVDCPPAGVTIGGCFWTRRGWTIAQLSAECVQGVRVGGGWCSTMWLFWGRGGYSGGVLLSAPFGRWRWIGIGETGGDDGLGNEAKVGVEGRLVGRLVIGKLEIELGCIYKWDIYIYIYLLSKIKSWREVDWW